MLKENKRTGIGLAAIGTLYMVTMGVTVILPVLSALAGRLNQGSLSLLAPVLIVALVIAASAAGYLLGERMGYEKVALSAAFFTLIGGCAGSVLTAYGFRTAAAAFCLLTGFGLGLLVPFGFALAQNRGCENRMVRILGALLIGSTLLGNLCRTLGAGMADGGLTMIVIGLSLIFAAAVFALLLQKSEMEALAIHMIDWQRRIRDIAVLAGFAVSLVFAGLVRTWFGFTSTILTAGLMLCGFAVSMMMLSVLTWASWENFFGMLMWFTGNVNLAGQNNAMENATVDNAWTDASGRKKTCLLLNENVFVCARRGVLCAGYASG